MGGGGFSTEPDNLALDVYTIEQARRANPSVCFVATASGDAATYIVCFYAAFSQLSCQPCHLTLFDRTPDLRSLLLRQDIIYVGGGNTKSMLGVWREWGLVEILREAWDAGVVLAGISAGAICWFETGITDSWKGRLAPMACLGLLSGACCPHYDSEPERRPALHDLVVTGAVSSALALEDGAAAHFVGDKLFQVVTSRPNANAYHVRLDGCKAVDDVLSSRRLEKAMLSSAT